MPKVSVVMSVYNGEKYLQEAVESILNQTFQDFEFIIVDDGSTDGTKQILESLIDERVKVFTNQTNLGLANSLNRGWSLAQGEYIARMDADDISLPDRLEKEVDFLDTHPETGMVSTAYVSIDQHGHDTMLVTFPTDNQALQERLLKHCCFCHGAAMIRRPSLEVLGGYRSTFRAAQDYDLWLRLAEKYEVANLPEPLYKMRVNPDSISVRQKYVQEQFVQLAKELTRKRRETGQDWLQTMAPEAAAKLIAQRLPQNTREQLSALSYGYFFWARAMHERGQRRHTLILALKALGCNPVNKQLWAWVAGLVKRKVTRQLSLDKQKLVGEDFG